ncbi:PepSY-associated TM helix domain-containing protein [Lysobacter sp. LF1]|uniref:PepSY-associated TM helix domain-containing protein n=1 Tax=Lysobacter stagni TaxID=3045172 RepID=A0ABT6XB53_9GAMM|nr:PepSY-associated TM helix domain-containing protein [Lysobacter sp. LF1]MDI9237370.1 PepSY-associated TM helix domain-containing protein [Lysobacter sp. LF1]
MASTPLTTHAPPRRRVRAVLSWLHLWVGLTVGIVFALCSLAGTVLVFHVDLLKLQHPQLAQHAPVADGRVLARLIERWGPEGMRSLDLPREDLPVWQAYFEDGHRQYFAPEDGALLLYRSHHDDVLMWLHEWHVELLGGKTGKEVLGVFGWTSLALVLIGLYLWWPRSGRYLAQLKVHAGPPVRRWLSWHRSSGVVLLPLLLLATVTGIGMVYGRGFQKVFVAAFGGENVKAPELPKDTASIDWTKAIAQARAALPDARLARVSVPDPDEGVVAFRAQANGEWHPVGRSTVSLSREGRVLQTVDATTHRLGLRMSQALYPLHVGAVGGTTMKWVTAVIGLLPAFLLVTGFLFWRRRRGHR